MKKCLLSLLLLFAFACDKEAELPAWDLYMSIADIEQYAATQGSVNERALMGALTSAVFRAPQNHVHIGGEWRCPDGPMFMDADANQYFLFDAEGRCEEATVVFPAGYNIPLVSLFGWYYDAGRKTIVLHATGDATDVVAEMEVLYFAADRLIVREIYHAQERWVYTGDEKYVIDQVYYVGDLSSFPRNEFDARFHTEHTRYTVF